MVSKTIAATMATGVTITSAIPISGWDYVSVETATFAAAFAGASVAINVSVSNDLTGTFRPLKELLNSGTTFSDVQVAVPAGVGGFNTHLPLVSNYNYMKLDTDVATTNTVELTVNVCMNKF
jgi:hypothetical protein